MVSPMDQRRILVVDDDPDAIVFYVTLLEAAGYPVTVAPNGQVALAHAVDTPLAAILLDARLSDGSGVDLCPQLRAYLASTVPIILVTADQSPASVEQATVLLHKPFEPAALLSLLPDEPSQQPQVTRKGWTWARRPQR
jgi:DNA-binding response OmpR family regulator